MKVEAAKKARFFVQEVPTPNSASSDVKTYGDLLIDFPTEGKEATAEEIKLYLAINAAVATIIKACRNLSPANGVRASEKLTDYYIRKIGTIARIGLENGQVDLATQALGGLTQQFVMSEADSIKNGYIKQLGLVAGLCFSIFSALFVALHHAWGDQVALAKLYALAGLGASVGTWLSFAIRKEALKFEELANIEIDMLRPIYRLAFVIGLTMTVCLLFTSDAVQLQVGNLQTNVFATGGKSKINTEPTNKADKGPAPSGAAGSTPPAPPQPASAPNDGNSKEVRWPSLVAILVGLLCGVSERALAGAVSKRSATFAGSLGGS